MKDEQDIRVNCDDLQQKRRLVALVGALKGFQRVRINRSRPARSLNQNAWYWSCIVQAVVDWMKDANDEDVTPEEVHRFLVARFLGTVDKVNKATGEVLFSEPVETKKLNSAQFAEYCDRVRDFVAEYMGVIVEDPNPAWREAKQGEAA